MAHGVTGALLLRDGGGGREAEGFSGDEEWDGITGNKEREKDRVKKESKQ